MVGIKPYEIRLLRDTVKIYTGPGTEYISIGSLSKRERSVIVEETQDRYAERWGRLKTGAGWIILKYTQRVEMEKDSNV